jgi:hypothetical protein
VSTNTPCAALDVSFRYQASALKFRFISIKSTSLRLSRVCNRVQQSRPDPARPEAPTENAEEL